MNTPTIRTAGIVNVRFGRDVTVVNPVNLYGCEIGDGAFIGPFVEIQSNVKIGPRCRIQSHAFICGGVTMGEECFISHGAMFINDTMASGRPNFDPAAWSRTTLGDRVVIGTNATILPVSICSGVVVGAGSVVTRDIALPGIYAGNPARRLRSP